MKPPERYPPDDPREWLNRARSNLAMPKNRVEGAYLEDLCFEAQQAAAAMRKAVVGVYAHNVAKEIVGAVCMKRLEGFLDDTDETVRSEVSTAFFSVSDEWLLRSREFVLRFIESKAFESGPYDVLRVLEESKLAVQQAADASLRMRCLDLIDQMEELGYFGIDSELAKLER